MAAPKKVLAVTEIGVLTVQTVGAFDPYSGDVYLPSPRAYAAVWALWGILGGVAELGGAWARWAANLSVLVFLTALVLGRGSRKVLQALERIAGTSDTGREEAPAGGGFLGLGRLFSQAEALGAAPPGTAAGANALGNAAGSQKQPRRRRGG